MGQPSPDCDMLNVMLDYMKIPRPFYSVFYPFFDPPYMLFLLLP